MNRKVLYLATGVFDKGGIARYSRYQIQALRDLLGEGQVSVLSVLGPDANSFEDSFAVSYHGGGLTKRDKFAFMKTAVKHCMAERPEVVWCNHLNLLPLALALRPFRPGLKVALNVYGLELWSNRQWLHRHTLPRADLVVADCHFSGDYTQETYRVKPSRLRILWDCVDTRRFSPGPRNSGLMKSLGIPEGEGYRYVMTLGRMDVPSRYKGYDRLIDAIGSLREHPEYVALMVGTGDDRARMERRVVDEGLAGRVFFLGSVSEGVLADVYNLCDVFALVSDRGHGRGEGIPLTPLEAAACGKPIITGNEDGSQEAVVQGVNGYTISPRDSAALPGALKELFTNDETRRRMGAAARARIETEFSYEVFRAKTTQCLDDLYIQHGHNAEVNENEYAAVKS